MPFRLRDNTKLSMPDSAELAKFVDVPLDEVISLLENKFKFQPLNDVQGQRYQLVTMKKHYHILEMFAHMPDNSDTWIVVEVLPLREEAKVADC